MMADYSEPILLARQAREDLEAAKRRYHAAMQECLPPGTQVRYCAHNGRWYDGVITKSMSHSGYVTIRSLHTGKVYEVNLHFIEGL